MYVCVCVCVCARSLTLCTGESLGTRLHIHVHVHHYFPHTSAVSERYILTHLLRATPTHLLTTPTHLLRALLYGEATDGRAGHPRSAVEADRIHQPRDTLIGQHLDELVGGGLGPEVLLPAPPHDVQVEDWVTELLEDGDRREGEGEGERGERERERGRENLE